MKICKSCKKLRQNKSFYISYTRKGTSILSSECKDCSKKRTITYGKKNKDKRYSATIKHLYGITKEDYEKLLKDQNNKCKICLGKETHKSKKKFNIDHCHKTGKVRGLLCNRCNVGLGRFRDNINILKNAIEYLECQK